MSIYLILLFGIVLSATVAAAAARPKRSRLAAGADGLERLLVIGTSPIIGRVIEEIASRPELRWRVVGWVGKLPFSGGQGAGPWLGPPANLARIIAATHPTRILLAPGERRRRAAEEALLDARFQGITVEDPVNMLEELTGKLPIERLTSRSLVAGTGFRYPDTVPTGSAQIATRVLSVAGAIAGLVLLSPLLALICIAIRLDSPGPVLFIQPRVGMGGRPFDLLKFRTMRETAVRQSEWVRDNAARITRVGYWLRRFRLDELPQLVNVVHGDMNMVGPRPHPMSNAELFLARIPHYRLRSTVRPGITGWAQIRYGYANGLEEETEKMRYDLYYIKHRSLYLDLWILLATVSLLIFDRRSHEHVRHAPTPTVFPRPAAAPVRRGALQ